MSKSLSHQQLRRLPTFHRWPRHQYFDSPVTTVEVSNSFQEVINSLDLVAAVRRGSQRNDLLPPRLEDDVLGEVGKRFSESLKTKLSRGRYDPFPAEVVLVPKPGNTTRPAALLTLADRVVYDAIVETLRPRIDTALLGEDLVLWPRGIDSPKRWQEFEEGALATNPSHIALADVAAFYETIDHERLREALITMTGRGSQVNALIDFLKRTMAGGRGLPQGLSASDPIASAYLSPVDAAMARAGFAYARHGDDIRVAVTSVSQARESLHSLEQELRRIGLLMNSSKAIIMQREAYKNSIERSTQIHERARDSRQREWRRGCSRACGTACRLRQLSRIP
jgi:hypothetical protein